MRSSHLLAVALVCVAAAAPARAVESCELNGQHVNPSNGNTTAGKTGPHALPRRRRRPGRARAGAAGRRLHGRGPLLQGRPAREGATASTSAATATASRASTRAAKPAPSRCSCARRPIATAAPSAWSRSWYPSGQLRRVSFHGDDDRELASAEFTADGKLYELRCAPRAVLGADADDARWCGHAGGASNVVLYNGKGVAKARVSYERGERRKSELLGEGGAVREVQESSASGGVERSFYADGVKRREVQWVVAAGERAGRVVTLDQEFHESGKLVRERRWRVVDRGGELASEQHWYLNGQPKERTEYVVADGRSLRQETTYHDNGKKAFEGSWRVATPASRSREVATGVHRTFDDRRPPARRAPPRRARPRHARARARRQRQRRPRRRGLRGRLAQGVRQMIERGEFDYVIVGGGSAGCVLAARLSENPFVRVCLLEAGPADKSVLVHCPAGLALLAKNGAYNWGFETVPQPGLGGRRGYQPRGKVLGGSSSVNAMIYVRGQPEDYDGWAAEGNPGWGWDDVLPYFRRAEHNERGGDAFHGQGGPLNVMDLRSPHRFGPVFVEAAQQAGHAFNATSTARSQEGVGLYQVTHKNGERFSAAKAYLTPNLGAHQPARDHRRDDDADPSSTAGARPASKRASTACRRSLRARREVLLVGRRAAVAAAADAVGHRPRRAPALARHRRRATTCPASAATCTTTSTSSPSSTRRT